MGQLSAKYASMTDGQAVSKSPGALGLSALQSCFCIEHLRGEFLAAKFRAEIIGNFRRLGDRFDASTPSLRASRAHVSGVPGHRHVSHRQERLHVRLLNPRVRCLFNVVVTSVRSRLRSRDVHCASQWEPFFHGA